jgi:hypothetical protein
MQNWIRIQVFISLDRVVEGSRSDNLTKVIMEPLMIGGCLLKDQNAQKLYVSRQMVSIYFMATIMVLQNKSKTIILLIL